MPSTRGLVLAGGISGAEESEARRRESAISSFGDTRFVQVERRVNGFVCSGKPEFGDSTDVQSIEGGSSLASVAKVGYRETVGDDGSAFQMVKIACPDREMSHSDIVP